MRSDYFAFANEHGGDEARVHISGALWLFPDGAELILPAGKWATATWRYPEPPLYAGQRQKEEIKRTVLSNICLYWQTKLDDAADEFRNLKREVEASVQEHQVPGDTADLERLGQLAEEVRKYKAKVKKANLTLRKSYPLYRTPEQQREDAEMEERIADDTAQFEEQLRAITI